MFEKTINQTVINNKLLRMKTISELFFLIIMGEGETKFRAH